jgi:hypothetical protein
MQQVLVKILKAIVLLVGFSLASIVLSAAFVFLPSLVSVSDVSTPILAFIFHFIIFAICAGPLLPMLATLFVPNATPRRRRQNIARLLYLSLIQGITFIPYLYGLVFDRPEYGLASWIPVFPGFVLLVLTSIYAISEFMNASTRTNRPHDA